MTTALVLPSRCDVPTALPEMMQLANFLANSPMMPKHLQGEPASLLAVMYKALALEIPLATAWENVIVQEGKTGLTTALMQALVLRAGFDLFPADTDEDHATVRAVRPGIGPNAEGSALVTFTLADAERAELIKRKDGKVMARSFKGNALPWEKYTPDMLVARAISRAGRRYFPDTLMGMVYTPEELGAEVDADGHVVRANAIRVDTVEPEIKKLILRIRAAAHIDTLRSIYDEITEQEIQGALTPDGLTLSQLVGRRRQDLETQTATEAKKTARAAKKATVTVEAEVVAEPEVVASVVGTDPTADPETDFDQTTPPQEGAAADTEDTARRRAVLQYLAEHFIGSDRVEAEAVTRFGKPLDTVGTGELQEWLISSRKESQ